MTNQSLQEQTLEILNHLVLEAVKSDPEEANSMNMLMAKILSHNSALMQTFQLAIESVVPERKNPYAGQKDPKGDWFADIGWDGCIDQIESNIKELK